MTDDSSAYASFRSGRERIALGLVLLVVLGLPLAALSYQRLSAAGPVRVVALTARLPTAEHGGWTPETITVQRGERVKLRLSSDDVVHGFSIPKLGIYIDWVEPGKVTEVEFVAEQAGRYAFQCTVWCQLGHWRMRGVLEVIDPDDPAASARDADPPTTDWVASGIDIDAKHPGQFAPETPPDAANGARLWSEVSTRPLVELLAGMDLRLLTPSDVYVFLSRTAEEMPAGPATSHVSRDSGDMPAVRTASLPDLPEAAALARLAPADRWDIVAALFYAATTPGRLAASAQLYARDCTGCHGLAGRGDGPGAAAIGEQNAGRQGDHSMAMDKAPADFSDLTAQAGASGMLYYGKMVRGGMGTSMPYWGTIYGEDELWAMIAYLRSFAFEYPPGG